MIPGLSSTIRQIVEDLSLPVCVSTNGALLRDCDIARLTHPLVEVAVSVHGTPQIHDHIVGSQILETVAESIGSLVRGGAFVKILTTVTTQNYSCLLSDEFLTYVQSKLRGVRYLALSPLLAIGRGRNTPDACVSTAGFNDLVGELDSKLRPINIEVYARTPALADFRVAPKGGVYVLAEMEQMEDLHDGNVSSQSLEDILIPPSLYWLFHQMGFTSTRLLRELVHSAENPIDRDNIAQCLLARLSESVVEG